MELSKKSVGVIIALIITSLLGLIILQTYLLKYTIELKEQAFRRNVFSALNSVVVGLETGETASMLHVSEVSPTSHNRTVPSDDGSRSRLVLPTLGLSTHKARA